MDNKQCYRCKRTLAVEFFYHNRTTSDGLGNECKDCRRQIYQEHRVEILAKKKAQYKPHPKPSILAHDGKKRCTRCKETKEATSAFFNRSKISADGFYNECRTCRTQLRELRIAQSRERWARLKDGGISDSARTWRLRIRQEMLDAYGRRCACCDEAHEEFLQLDHIGGRNETNHPWSFKSGTGVYGKLKKLGWPDAYRLLCANCNWAIRLGGTCPHERAA